MVVMDFKDVELAHEVMLPQHTYAAVRVDGKNFSKATRTLRKDTPFNDEFSDRMEETARALLTHVEGAFLAYVGSDEVSVLFQDLGEATEKWFGGRVQKIASVSASIATAAFNAGGTPFESDKFAFFDSRVFDLGPDVTLVEEYLKARRASFVKNSVSMVSAHYFTHREVQGVSTRGRIEMLADDGHPWEEFAARDRFGTVFFKAKELRLVEFDLGGETHQTEAVRTVVRSDSPVDSSMFREILS